MIIINPKRDPIEMTKVFVLYDGDFLMSFENHINKNTSMMCGYIEAEI